MKSDTPDQLAGLRADLTAQARQTGQPAQRWVSGRGEWQLLTVVIRAGEPVWYLGNNLVAQDQIAHRLFG